MPTMSKSLTTTETGPFTRYARPIHPGEMLREEFMPDYGLTVAALAEALHVSRQTVNELVRERRRVSPDMAFRLSRLFGNSTEQWLNLQRGVDLWDAEHNAPDEVWAIVPLKAPALSPSEER